MKDSLIQSLFKGRLLASVLAIGASIAGLYGYSISPEELQNFEVLITSVITGVAGIIAALSKFRESKK